MLPCSDNVAAKGSSQGWGTFHFNCSQFKTQFQHHIFLNEKHWRQLELEFQCTSWIDWNVNGMYPNPGVNVFIWDITVPECILTGKHFHILCDSEQ